MNRRVASATTNLLRTGGFLVLALLLTVGCGKERKAAKAAQKSTFSEESSAPGGPLPTAEDVVQENAHELAYYRRVYVEGYDASGTHDARWDADARQAAEAFARIRTGEQVAGFDEQIHRLSRSGCTDPLIGYLGVRQNFSSAWGNTLADAVAFRDAGLALSASSYPALARFYGALRGYQAIMRGNPNPTQESAVPILWARVESTLDELLNESALPESELRPTLGDVLGHARVDATIFKRVFLRAEGALQTHWKDSSEAEYLRGRGHRELAWLARGSGFSDSVTDEGWQAFAEEMEIAQKHLMRSWKLRRSEAVALEMMQLELGQGRGRFRMEMWFDRAMALNPGSTDACGSKIWYLMPRWHGTHEDILEFARQCTVSTQWTGEVRLTILNAHERIAMDSKSADATAYWRRPGVWEECREALDAYFQSPDAKPGWHHDYARLAWRAQDWASLNRQIPLLGNVNLSFFGGEDAYKRMLQEAEAHRDKP
jgi:hypothetical protein